MTTAQPAVPDHCLGRFAFLIHPTRNDDMIQSIHPAILASLTPAKRQVFQQWLLACAATCTSPGVAFHLPALPSAKVDGGYVEGWLIGMPHTPERMMRLGRQERDELIGQCVEIARDLGADVLGLGAFTSIITRNGLTVADCGLHVTSGNGLTAMSAAASMEELVRQRGDCGNECALGIIGAAGSVGRIASLRLAKTFAHITLFGNPEHRDTNKMKALAGELYQEALRRTGAAALQGVAAALKPVRAEVMAVAGDLIDSAGAGQRVALTDRIDTLFQQQFKRQGPLRIDFDLAADLHRMRYVLTATSKGKAFVDPALFGPGTVVCDVARPSDVLDSIKESAQAHSIHAYQGGIMNLPGKIVFGNRNVVGCAPGTNLACLSETMVLALAQAGRNYSIGPATPLEEAESVLAMAHEHGFSVSIPRFEAQLTAEAA